MKGILAAVAAGSLMALLAIMPGWAQDSGTIFDSAQPVQTGDVVRSLILYPQGFTGLGDVKVTGYYPDDVTTYWAGQYNGGTYVYDAYSGFWKPTPISYEYATLDFSGKQLEGWVRNFGGRLDRNVFIGRDGIIYKRINITKKHRANGRVRRRVVYTYFINLATMARSDGKYTAAWGNTQAEQIMFNTQQAAQEAALARVAAANPAFPKWQHVNEPAQQTAQPVKEVVTAPGGQTTEAQEKSVAELMEEQVGPFQQVGPQVPKSGPKP